MTLVGFSKGAMWFAATVQSDESRLRFSGVAPTSEEAMAIAHAPFRPVEVAPTGPVAPEPRPPSRATLRRATNASGYGTLVG